MSDADEYRTIAAAIDEYELHDGVLTVVTGDQRLVIDLQQKAAVRLAAAVLDRASVSYQIWTPL